MKLFDVDWGSVLRELPVWETLPRPARHLVLTTLKLHGFAPRAQFESQLDLIEASGMTIATPNHVHLAVREESRPLVKVLRAMYRHPVFDEPSTPQLVHYLEQHFSATELQGIGGAFESFRFTMNRHVLAPRVASAYWVRDLLDATSKTARTEWMAERGLSAMPLFAHEPGLVATLQRLVRELAASPDGVPLTELVRKTDAAALPSVAKAVHAGLTTLVLFAGMRQKDLEPMIGLWPSVAKELSRPAPAPPAAVAPDEEFVFPVGVEDMTTVLASACGSPMRMRTNDLMVFARTRAELEERLVAIPQWAQEFFPTVYGSRVDDAVRSLVVSELAEVVDRHGSPHLSGTPAGVRWLARSAHHRLATVLDPIRAAPDVNPGTHYESLTGARFFPFTFPWHRPARSLHLRDALTKAFLATGNDFVPLDEFLSYHEREVNPLLASMSPTNLDPNGFGGHAGDPRDVSRSLWRSALRQFLVGRLLALGGATLGRMRDNRVCFRLTDVGRYLLGNAATFEYGSDAAGDVVVQPNFDVVFLGAAPSAEAAIARFAERVGRAPGLVFRITKPSVLAAAESGMAVADVMGALVQTSSKPVPKNVEREIAGWMAAVRRASLRDVELIECADEESAARVAAALGGKVRQIAPTIFELPEMSGSARTAMLKRLRAAGVFLDVVDDGFV